jgi:hypothetical protein
MMPDDTMAGTGERQTGGGPMEDLESEEDV